MSFWSKLFGKKSKVRNPYYMDEDDGQELYFREDFEEKKKKKTSEKKAVQQEDKIEAEEENIVKNSTKPKAEQKTAATAVKKTPAKASTAKKSAVTTKKASSTTKPSPAPTKNNTSKTVNTSTSKTAAKQEVKNTVTGKFEIKKAKDGRFVFNLYAPNHIIVATSQVYSSSSAAVNGIQSIITNAESAPVEDNTLKNPTKQSFPKWEMYIDKAGEYRFRLYASNGNCIVHSQGYKQKASCKNGIESIIRCSKNPEIDKAYLNKE